MLEPVSFPHGLGLGWEWVEQIICKWQLASDPCWARPLGQVLESSPPVQGPNDQILPALRLDTHSWLEI